MEKSLIFRRHHAEVSVAFDTNIKNKKDKYKTYQYIKKYPDMIVLVSTQRYAYAFICWHDVCRPT